MSINPNILSSHHAALVGVIDPDATAASVVSTGWINMANFERLMAIIFAGTLGASATVDAKLEQATDGAGAGVDGWRLSSDSGIPGGSLHGDWLGGWNEVAIEKWIDGCFDPGGEFSGPRNCSGGQTGRNGTGRAFRRVSNLNDYTGENFLLDPHPAHSDGSDR